MKSYNNLSTVGRASFPSLLSRDKGLYDNLPFQWFADKTKKKQLYDCVNELSRANKDTDGIVIFDRALTTCLQLRIMNLILEEKDIYSSKGVSLGGAVVIGNPLTWFSTPSKSTPTIEDFENQSACIVNCHLDELISLSLALDKPILCNKALFSKVSMDAELVNLTPSNENENTSTKLCIFADVGEATSSTKDCPLAWEIMDPNLFFKLSSTEKRAILRASGLEDIPRPRLGEEALNDALLDMMDDAVREEVRRLREKALRGKP